MLSYIDKLLNKIVMYKLVLIGLSVITLYSFVLTLLGLMPFGVVDFTLSLGVLLIVCQNFNKIISILAKIPVKKESTYITALILFLLFLPSKAPNDLFNLAIVGFIAVISKFIFVFGRSHIFNPAAIATTLGSIFLGLPAMWWVGNTYLIPVVVLVGLLIVRKTQKEQFAAIVILVGILTALINFGSLATSLTSFTVEILTSWPLVFFATVMATEPLTMPAVKKYQYAYAIVIGILFGSQFKLGPFFSTPENALLIANLLLMAVNPRIRYQLKLMKQKKN